jgi:predicted acyl esterase
MSRARAATVACLALIAMAPVAAFLWAQDRLTDLRQETAIVENTIAELQQRLQSSADGSDRSAEAMLVDFHVDGATEAVAAAALQAQLATLAREAEIDIDEFEVMRALDTGTQAEAEPGIRLRLAFKAGNDAFQAMLYAIEQGRPAMRVQSLRLATFDADEAPILNADLVVEAYRRLEP